MLTDAERIALQDDEQGFKIYVNEALGDNELGVNLQYPYCLQRELLRNFGRYIPSIVQQESLQRTSLLDFLRFTTAVNLENFMELLL